MGMLDALRTRVLAEPWVLLLVLALGSYFVLVHRPRAAANHKAHKLRGLRREAAEWRNDRYWRWQEERQHAEPGLRPALLRLALAALLQPRLAADAPAGTADLPGDVVGVVGDAVESALQLERWSWTQVRRAGRAHQHGAFGRIQPRRYEDRAH